MKKFLTLILLSVAFLTSCQDETTIFGNPVVSQINILEGEDGKEFKYEVVFKSEFKDNVEVPKMQTNFRYQVGDTLLSFYENYELKIRPIRDSLNFYRSKYANILLEFQAQKNYIEYLQSKLPKE